jgi:hypothetical protein
MTTSTEVRAPEKVVTVTITLTGADADFVEKAAVLYGTSEKAVIEAVRVTRERVRFKADELADEIVKEVMPHLSRTLQRRLAVTAARLQTGGALASVERLAEVIEEFAARVQPDSYLEFAEFIVERRARDSKKRRAFEVLAAFGKEVAESLLVRPDVVDAFELVQGKFPPGAWVPGQNASVVQFCLVLHGDMAARRIP